MLLWELHHNKNVWFNSSSWFDWNENEEWVDVIVILRLIIIIKWHHRTFHYARNILFMLKKGHYSRLMLGIFFFEKGSLFPQLMREYIGQARFIPWLKRISNHTNLKRQKLTRARKSSNKRKIRKQGKKSVKQIFPIVRNWKVKK